ncbi:MAG: condensation domain-containing protein, partial [Gaiellaceae bacterium]
MRVLLREVSALYPAFAAGELSPLPPPSPQYADFAAWQRDWLGSEAAEQHATVWERRLADAPASLDLPTIHCPTVRTFEGARRRVTIPIEVVRALQELSRTEGVPLSTSLLAAFQMLLARYSGHDDVVVGATAERPSRTEIEAMLGPVLNTLVVRTSIADNPTVRDLLVRVREAVLTGLHDQEFPFELLVERLKGERDPSRTPIFQVQFVCQEALHQALTLPGIEVASFPVDPATARFDLTLSLQATGQVIEGYFEYDTARFGPAMIERLVASYETALRSLPSSVASPVSELPLLDDRQLARLREWSGTVVDDPDKRGLGKLFEEQVERTPDALA